MTAPSAAYSTLQADPGRQEIWLLEVDVLNLDTQVETTLYFSSAQYGTGPYDTPASRAYKACITSGFEFSGSVEQLNGPIYGILPARSAGSIVLSQRLGDLDLGDAPNLADTPLRDFAMAGRRAVVRHGGYSPRLGRMLHYTEFYTVFSGIVDGQPLIASDIVTINLRSKDSLFQYPINTRTYFGCKGAVLFPSRSSGSNEVSAGTNTVFNFTTGDFSWEFLLYVADLPPANETWITKGAITVSGYTIGRLTTGEIRFSTHQAGVSQHTISAVIPLEKWTRISIVRDGATVLIYQDGVDITDTAGTHINPTSAAAKTLAFGRNDAAAVIVKGMMSDIRCWSIALTESEINSRMHRPLDSSEYALTGLVGYWPADDGTLTTLAQKVAATTSSNGTLSGGAVFTPSLMGDTDLQGNPMPQTWGYFDGFEPLLVDEGRRVYQIHSGPMESIDRVDIGGGSASTLGSSSPYTNLVDFLAASTTSGQHDTCITDGGSYVRFGSSPAHPVTIAGQGDNTGGVFRGTVSSLVRFIACNMGWYPLTDPTDLDTDSFDDLETANSASVGHAYKNEQSVADVLNFLLQTVGAVAFFRRSSDLLAVTQHVNIGSVGTPVATITENDIDSGEIEVLENNTPTFRVDLGWRHNYRVLAPTDFTAGVATSSREKFVRREWRICTQIDRTVKRNFPDAITVIYNTAFYRWFDAITEAARQLSLLSSRSQGFRFKIKQGHIDLDRMDIIYFDYGDYDVNGTRQNRFGSGPTRKMRVLDVADDAETSGSVITIWRDNV